MDATSTCLVRTCSSTGWNGGPVCRHHSYIEVPTCIGIKCDEYVDDLLSMTCADHKLCMIEGCGKPRSMPAWCDFHWMRFQIAEERRWIDMTIERTGHEPTLDMIAEYRLAKDRGWRGRDGMRLRPPKGWHW